MTFTAEPITGRQVLDLSFLLSHASHVLAPRMAAAFGDFPQAWGVVDGQPTGPLVPYSTWTIAVRAALKDLLDHGHFDTAGGLAVSAFR